MSWWDTLSDDVVAFWKAYWRVEPFGCEWHMHAESLQLLDAIYAGVINVHLPSSKRYRPHDASAFMPADYVGDENKKRPSIEQQLDAFVGR